VIGGDRAGEVTGGDERTDGRAQVVSGRATREGKSAADEWGRPVSGGGGAAGGRAGDGPRLAQPRGGDFPFSISISISFISFFSFEQIFSYIFLGVKNILCEVLLKIMVYAYDEMPYEVGYEEIIKGG
jgi:hypothetical protein